MRAVLLLLVLAGFVCAEETWKIRTYNYSTGDIGSYTVKKQDYSSTYKIRNNYTGDLCTKKVYGSGSIKNVYDYNSGTMSTIGKMGSLMYNYDTGEFTKLRPY